MKVIIGVIVVLVLLGALGKATTSRYPCHTARIGDSIVCE
jgi:hypothetical protein